MIYSAVLYFSIRIWDVLETENWFLKLPRAEARQLKNECHRIWPSVHAAVFFVYLTFFVVYFTVVTWQETQFPRQVGLSTVESWTTTRLPGCLLAIKGGSFLRRPTPFTSGTTWRWPMLATKTKVRIQKIFRFTLKVIHKLRWQQGEVTIWQLY